MSDGARWSNYAGREIRRRAVAFRNSEHKIAFCRSAVDVERMRYFYHLPGCCYGHSIDRQDIAYFPSRIKRASKSDLSFTPSRSSATQRFGDDEISGILQIGREHIRQVIHCAVSWRPWRRKPFVASQGDVDGGCVGSVQPVVCLACWCAFPRRSIERRRDAFTN